MEPTMNNEDQESPIEVVYEKDKKREEAEEKISDILGRLRTPVQGDAG